MNATFYNNLNDPGTDKSNGYQGIAEHFLRARNPRIGPANVREWCRTLIPGCAVLDLGCGFGVPISQVLIEEGFDVFGVDASAKLIAEFRKRFPSAHAQCCAVEDSDFFGRTFDAIIAWGLLFLLPPDVQPAVIHKVAQALNPKGKFLFTSTEQPVTWKDSLTDRESISLGAERYRQILKAEGLALVGEQSDEGENHYYLSLKP
jgi:2-polyprenyl-3-methyl-5-hydroxy-6-metoxy-1,4-benzoquinol methylase